jgi:hypothetical protein
MERDVEQRPVDGLVTEKIVCAEREGAQPIPLGHAVRDARLVIPIRERVIGRDERKQRARVAVTPSDERAAATAGERLLDHAARVEDARLRFAAGNGARRARLAGHDASRRASETSGVHRGKKVHPIDERGRQDRGPGTDVKEERHANAVDRVADVGRRRPAHREVRNPAQHGADAGKDFDHAEGVCERAGDEPDFVARNMRRAELLAPFAEHRDFQRRREVGRLGRRRHVVRRRRDGGRRRRGRNERNLREHASTNGKPVARRGREPPSLGGRARHLGKRGSSLAHDHLAHGAVLLDVELQHDARVARCAFRVRHRPRIDLHGRNDLGSRCILRRRVPAPHPGRHQRDHEKLPAHRPRAPMPRFASARQPGTRWRN